MDRDIKGVYCTQMISLVLVLMQTNATLKSDSIDTASLVYQYSTDNNTQQQLVYNNEI